MLRDLFLQIRNVKSSAKKLFLPPQAERSEAEEALIGCRTEISSCKNFQDFNKGVIK